MIHTFGEETCRIEISSTLKSELENIDWDIVVDSTNVNDAYSQFISKLNSTYDKCIPYKRFKSHKKGPNNPWITTGLLKSIRHKDKLYKKYIANPNESNKTKYDRYRNSLTNLIRMAKSDFYSRSFEQVKHNMSSNLKLINQILNKSPEKPATIQAFCNGTDVLTDPSSIANQFNKFFTSIGPELAAQIAPSDADPISYVRGAFPHSLFSNRLPGMKF